MGIIKDLVTGQQESFMTLEGSTIQECINFLEIETPLIELNGKRWIDTSYVLKEHDIVNFFITPKKSGKELLKSIAIMAVAGWASNAIFGKMFGGQLTKLNQGVRAVATGLIGSAISKAVIKPQLQGNSDYSSDPRNASITGTRNKVAPYGVVPKLMGCMRVYPYKIGEYSEVIGKDEYLRSLFLITSGTAEITDIKIGTQSIDNYSDVTYHILENKSSSSELQIFTKDVYTDTSLNLQLTETFQTWTTQANADQITIDLTLPQGLVGFDANGNKTSQTVDLDIEYKKSSEPDTEYKKVSYSSTFEGTEGVTTNISSGTTTDFSSNTLSFDGTEKRVRIQPYLGNFDNFQVGDSITISNTTNNNGVFTVANKGQVYINNFLYNYLTFNETVVDEYNITAIVTFTKTGSIKYINLTDKITSPTKKAITFRTLTRDTYTIRAKRTNAESTDPKINNRVDFSALKTITFVDPAPNGNTYIELKIRATDQLNGVIENLSCLAKQQVPVYNGSVWTDTIIDTTLATSDPSFKSNIAWCYADVLKGVENRKAVTDSRIDLTTLLEWDGINESSGYTFNAYLDGKKPIFEVLKDISATGRANPLINQQGKYSVSIDKEQTLAKQMFTTRNFNNYSFSKVFKTQPDAIKGIFLNEEKDYERDEIVIDSDGNILTSTGSLTNTEEYRVFGITKYENVYKHIRYLQACSILRPIIHSFDTDFEYLVVNKGDKILLQQDILNPGAKPGRITDLTSGATITDITVDEECNMTAGTAYGVTIRHFNGSTTDLNTYSIVNNPSENKTLTFVNPVTLGDISIGDLMAFGEQVRITDELIISEIQPRPNLRARITAFNYNDSIYDVDQPGYVIPTFTSVITQPVSQRLGIPDEPTITNIVSDETVLIKKGDGSLISQIVFNLNYTGQVDIEKFQVQYRFNTATGQYTSFDIPFDDATGIITNVDDGAVYEIRVRAMTKFGATSEWVTTTHTVVGKTSAPADVTGFTVSVIKNDFVYDWTLNTEKDIALYEIRKGTVWETADFVAKVDTNKFSTNEGVTGTGVVTFLIKAIDTTGNYSENATSATYVVQAPATPIITYGTVQNTVSIDWQDAETTFPIQRYEVRRGDTFATATVLNDNITGSFYRYNEEKAGLYKYWVFAEDTAENVSVESFVEINVDDPPGFSFIDNFSDDFTGTKMNCIKEFGNLVTMINSTETYGQHFTNNGFDDFQDFLDAGYNLYAEPTQTTATYVQTFDLGAVVTGGGKIIVNYDTVNVIGSTTISVDIAVSTDDISYTTYTGVTEKLIEIAFRYVKITLNYSGTGGNDIMKTTRLDVSVGLQDVRDAGSTTITTQGQTISTTKSFARIDNITPTILTTPPVGKVWAAPYALNQTAGTPATFDIYINTTDGTALGGLSSVDISWSVDGK